MLRVSKPKYLLHLLQRLMSPSTGECQSWSHRRLLWSMQAEHRKKSCTNDFKILEQVNVVTIVQGIGVNQLLWVNEVSEVELLRSCPDPFSRLPQLLENIKLWIFSEFQEWWLNSFRRVWKQVNKTDSNSKGLLAQWYEEVFCLPEHSLIANKICMVILHDLAVNMYCE